MMTDEPKNNDPRLDESPEYRIPGFRQCIVYEAGMGVLAIVLGVCFGPAANQWVPPVDQWREILQGMAIGTLIAMPLVWAVRRIQRLEFSQVLEIQHFTEHLLAPQIRRLTIVEVGTLAIVSGVSEELLFRGWLQGFLAGSPQQCTPISLALGITAASFVFGIMHPFNWLYVGVVFVMGLIFGSALVASGNMIVPVTAHAVYNFMQMLSMRCRKG